MNTHTHVGTALVIPALVQVRQGTIHTQQTPVQWCSSCCGCCTAAAAGLLFVTHEHPPAPAPCPGSGQCGTAAPQRTAPPAHHTAPRCSQGPCQRASPQSHAPSCRGSCQDQGPGSPLTGPCKPLNKSNGNSSNVSLCTCTYCVHMPVVQVACRLALVKW